MAERLRNGCNKKKLAGFCIYKLIVDFIYIQCNDLFPSINQYGLDFTFDRYLMSWLLFLLFTFFFNYFILDKDRLKERFSQQVYLLLFLLSVVPFFSMYGGGAISDACLFYYNVFFYVLLLVQIVINFNFNRDNSYRESSNIYISKVNTWKKRLFTITCAVITASIIITFFYYVGGSFFTDGLQVYGQRAIFNQISKNMPRIILYLLGFANIIEIIMIIYCLNKKKYLYVGLLLVLCYMHFSIAAERSVIFSIIIAVGIFFVGSKITVMKVIVFQTGITLLSLLLVFLEHFYKVTDVEQSYFGDVVSYIGSSVPASLFRRMVFDPAYLHNVYFNYFVDRTPNYWGINMDYGVGSGLANFISDVYFNSPLGNANNGLLGDCFTNMGDYGVFVYPIVLCFILCCFDYVLKGKNAIIFMGLALLFVNYIMNSMLTTIMLTHGGFVMLAMLWCFPDENEKMENEESVVM